MKKLISNVCLLAYIAIIVLSFSSCNKQLRFKIFGLTYLEPINTLEHVTRIGVAEMSKDKKYYLEIKKEIPKNLHDDFYYDVQFVQYHLNILGNPGSSYGRMFIIVYDDNTFETIAELGPGTGIVEPNGELYLYSSHYVYSSYSESFNRLFDKYGQ